jgi:hypothetical protein
MTEAITQSRLKEVMRYEPGTGVFVWLINSGKARPGSIAGGMNDAGYRLIGVDGRRYRSHRLAWLYVHGCWPDGVIDHKSGNRGSARIADIRPATLTCNAQNRGVGINNKTGYLGVCFNKRVGRYLASITADRKQRHLGHFKTAAQAYEAYLAAKAVLHPLSPVPR